MVKRFHVAALIEYDVMFPQGGQYLLFVNADTLLQLAVDFPVDFIYQLGSGLHTLFVALRGSGGYGLMVGHTYLVEFFQIGGVYGNKVDAFV